MSLVNNNNGQNYGSSISFDSQYDDGSTTSPWTQAKISAYTLDSDIEKGALKFVFTEISKIHQNDPNINPTTTPQSSPNDPNMTPK